MSTKANAVELIRKKRDGGEFSREELQALLSGIVDGGIPEYQAAAWLMAVFFQGMTPSETAALTSEMIATGRCLDLSGLDRPLVDKHSTGGVGDKVSLLLAPMAAACGLAVPMMSGRGLGHTGGTLDKLESIVGYNTQPGPERFREIVADCGYAMTGQSEDVVPADRLLYALRDVTGTVESIPLITSSILSKKFAEGAEALVLDVKCGLGAFMKTIEDARGLAQSLVATAKSLDRPLHASITRMDQPLGFMVGNFLEVEESCLLLGAEFHNAEAADDRSQDLIDLTEGLCARMLTVSGKIKNHDDALAEARRVRTDGTALELFLRNVELQGGKVDKLLSDLGKRRATVVGAVLAEQSGYVSELNAYKVGTAAVALGAGRRRMEDSVSPNVGIELQCKIGDTVIAGDMLGRVYGRSDEAVKVAAQALKGAYVVSEEECDPPHEVFLEEFSTDT